MKISVFSMIYGADRYFDQFEHCALASLLQPDNLLRVRDRFGTPEFHIYTLQEDVGRVQEVVTRSGLEDVARVRILPSPVGPNSGERRQFQSAALRHEVRHCVEADAHMLFANVDTIFGNGSVYRLAALAAQDPTRAKSYATPYLRVWSAEFQTRLSRAGWPVSNADLTAIALDTLHRSVSTDDTDLDRARSFYSGSQFWRLGSDISALRQRVPNVYLAKFNASDLAYFDRMHDFRVWDSLWPGKLVAENRLMIVGSGDIFCVACLTHPDKGGDIPSAETSAQTLADYQSHGLHNYTSRALVAAFRASQLKAKT